MSTQQDIYVAGSENRPPMLNKDNYVPWSSRLLCYAKSKPNGKLIYNSIMNGPYVRRMIPEPGDPDHEVPVAETFHEQTDDELTEKEVKQMEADDQAIQIILMGLPEDIYAAVDSCETAQEIWLRVQQMMKGSDIGIQDKKAKLFNEWERFTSTDGESIESYYHREGIQTKLLKTTNNNQRISSNHDNRQIAQPGMNLGQDKQMQMVGGNVGNQFRQYTGQNVGNQNGYNAVQTVRNQNLNPNKNGNVVAARAEGNTIRNNGNLIRCYNCRGLGYLARNCIVRPRKRDAAFLQTQLLIAQKEEAGIQLQAKEFDFMAAARDIEEAEEVNANCILMTNLLQASTSDTQTDSAPVYDSDGSVEVHHYENCYNNDIFNMFTQEDQYTKLLEPIPKQHQVQQNDSNVISMVSSVEQDGGIVEQHPATIEETRAYFESLYNNLEIEVEKVNSVNRKMKETNVDLTTVLARYKNQEKCFEINQEKYDKLERCYQKSFYQEQCLTKKINALHLSSAKMITTLNKEIANLNNQLSKEKSTVSFLNEENKKLKSNLKIHEDELLDKQIQLENKIEELDNILEAAKFVQDFKYLAKEADESFAKHKALEFEIERLLRAVGSQDIMSIVQNNSAVDTSNLQSELDCTKEKLENCIIIKEKEYAVLWNNWYTKCKECKYDKISYDKAYNDMQQKIERLQAQLGDLKGKCKDTPCVSNTLDPLS
ncbi:hypothetical protein Tco_1449013 [Tanacetum coccineum]